MFGSVGIVQLALANEDDRRAHGSRFGEQHVKVAIKRHTGAILISRGIQDSRIGGGGQADVPDVSDIQPMGSKQRGGAKGKAFVQQEPDHQ